MLKNSKRNSCLRPVIISAICGWVLFAVITFWGISMPRKDAGEGVVFLGIPADMLLGKTAFGQWVFNQRSEVPTDIAVIVVNGCVGFVGLGFIALLAKLK